MKHEKPKNTPNLPCFTLKHPHFCIKLSLKDTKKEWTNHFCYDIILVVMKKKAIRTKEKTIAKNDNAKTFYISTPLYYPSGAWHLGHSYTTVCCDAIARFKRLDGYEVFYLTGTDEHGQKIADKARENGKTPKEFVDGLTENIKELWAALGIQFDKFIRTTDGYHVNSVQKIFERLYKQGDIYKGNYSGKYCTPCESFFSVSQLKEGNCPDCNRGVVDFEEECYFFRLSKYQDSIEKLLKSGEFLLPDFRAKEMLNNFIKGGLQDLAVSRASVDWGVKVPFDTKHTIYVWIDALSNYINALGYNGDNKGMDKFWNKDKETVHMVGKEIVRFHTIIWPAILMALGLDVPKTVFAHGWLLLEGDKMSKSKGNTADPFVLVDKYGIDAVRYYLLREVPFGNDGVYSLEAFLTRINADLVNSLGNLVKRTIAMANQYFDGKVEWIKYNRDNDEGYQIYKEKEALSKEIEQSKDYDKYPLGLRAELESYLVCNMQYRSELYEDKLSGQEDRLAIGDFHPQDILLVTKINMLISDVKLRMNVNPLNESGSTQMIYLNSGAGLEQIFDLISQANKYIDITMPWVLNKEGKTDRLQAVLYNLLEAIRVSTNLLLPFIPNGAKRIFDCLGFGEVPDDFEGAKYSTGNIYKGMKDEILYKRIDIKKELEG